MIIKPWKTLNSKIIHETPWIVLKEDTRGLNEVEDIRTQKFTLQKIDNMITNGEIADSWTLSALYLYHRYKNSHK